MRPHGKYARVDPSNPEAFAQCDRCGFWRNRTDLVWQTQWAGTQIYNVQVLVCSDRCFDIPQEQLRTIILPPDPPPVLNARVPNLVYEEDGPPQTTLSANVNYGSRILPVESVTGFNLGDFIWVQLANATFAYSQIFDIVSSTNTFLLIDPLPYAAPYTGQVLFAVAGELAPQVIPFAGASVLEASARLSREFALAAFSGVGALSGLASLVMPVAFGAFQGSSAVSIITDLQPPGARGATFPGTSNLVAAAITLPPWVVPTADGVFPLIYADFSAGTIQFSNDLLAGNGRVSVDAVVIPPWLPLADGALPLIYADFTATPRWLPLADGVAPLIYADFTS